MKSDDKYRFNLQFGSDTEQNRTVGVFIEKLGNKKSKILVPIIYDYLQQHPEMLINASKVKLEVVQSITQAEIEAMVKQSIEKLTQSSELQLTNATTPAINSDDVDNVLDNFLGDMNSKFG